MLRTDRQKNFYKRIALLSISTGLTEMEKKNLEKSKRWLDRGDDFRIVYDSLGIALQRLESERLQGKLTPPVKKLFEDLKEAYGEPKESGLRIRSGGQFVRPPL